MAMLNNQWLVSIRMLKMRQPVEVRYGGEWCFAKRLRIPVTRCSHSAAPNSSCWSIPVMYWPGAVGDLTTCSSKRKGNLKQSEKNTQWYWQVRFCISKPSNNMCLQNLTGQVLMPMDYLFKLVYWGLIMLSHANVAVQNYHPQNTWFEHGSITYVSKFTQVTPQVFMTRPAHSIWFFRSRHIWQ
jgi:hypothetical protein